MIEEPLINLDVNERVEKIINETIKIYINKVINGICEIGLEATFQLYFAMILDKLLGLYTLDKDEHFQLVLEKNYPISNQRDYVDIAIEYSKGEIKKTFLIELKFKKISDSAPDLGTIYSYIDMFNLNEQKYRLSVADDCYFVFLTDLSTYKNRPRAAGTRMELPMFNGAKIKAGSSYKVTGKSALENTKKYPNGFCFNADHTIEYKHFKVVTDDYWFFIEKL